MFLFKSAESVDQQAVQDDQGEVRKVISLCIHLDFNFMLNKGNIKAFLSRQHWVYCQHDPQMLDLRELSRGLHC